MSMGVILRFGLDGDGVLPLKPQPILIEKGTHI